MLFISHVIPSFPSVPPCADRAPHTATSTAMSRRDRSTSTSRSRDLPPSWSTWLADANDALVAKGVDRALRPISPTEDPSTFTARVDALERFRANESDLGESVDAPGPSRRATSFSSNDYLGLGTHARTRAAASRAAARFGCGPRSSALICGYTEWHRSLEVELAKLCETEECLLFPTGYAANSTALQALCGDAECAVFSDALNHASIVDGCRLAKQGGASVHTFSHKDYDELERALRACEAKRKVVVSDSLFSMDGDYADVDRLVELRREYGFLLVLDEAHATLVCGDRGGGVAQAKGRCADVDVHVGTLSKAVGAHGGFVACSRAMKLFLLSRARGQMFSTALPAPAIAAAIESLKVFADEPSIRAKLWSNVNRMNAAIASHPILASTTRPLESPIGCVIIGTTDDALAAADELSRAGFHVPAIRPPTVPAGTCRLRIALSAAHSHDDIDALACALAQAVERARRPRSRL